jgi:hypothetical protein
MLLGAWKYIPGIDKWDFLAMSSLLLKIAKRLSRTKTARIEILIFLAKMTIT